MTNNVRSYAAPSATSPLGLFQFDQRVPREDDVAIEVLYCGVCHSDLHTARNDWKNTVYPVVPGHEIVGRVKSVGAEVSRFKVGDLVGVGCMVDSCQTCPACRKGWEQYCDNRFTGTYNAVDRRDGRPTTGGYGESVIVREKFVLRVPETLDTRAVAPLLCAGITTYSPLRHWKVGPESKVAVVGLGGLGHMALKLAKGMGAEVTLFTRSKGKEEEAIRLGADRVVLSTDPAQMAAVASHFDLIVDTVPYGHDLNPYVSTLATDGTLVLVGHLGPLDPSVNSAPMVLGRKAIAGSVIGGIEETQEMLDFCARQNILPDVEMIRIQDINAAYERMLQSDVKYRFVIDMASLRDAA